MHTSKSLLTAACIALALLFAQMAGAVHTLAHSYAELEQQQLPTLPDNCAQCLNFAHLGHALHTPQVQLSLPASAHELPASPISAFITHSARAACARGPPPAHA